MILDVDIRHRLGNFDLGARFSCSGRLIALFGPSGSGKTSVINMIGGLIRPDHGRIVADGRVLVDTAAGIFVSSHARSIGYVFQEPRLFPHLSVRHNLIYGTWFARRVNQQNEFDRVVDLLGVRQLLQRRPGALSGGEKQRIAIGRALLSNPKLLLMDEPLASLDEARKLEILPFIERLRDESRIPIVYVSHAISEVSRLATDIVLMADGRVLEFGHAADVMRDMGRLSMDGRDEAGTLLDTIVQSHDAAYDMTSLQSRAGTFHVAGTLGLVGARIRLLIKARDVMIATVYPQELSALNVLKGRIASIVASSGPMVEVEANCGGELILSRITRQSLANLDLAVGREVFLIVKSVSFDPKSLGQGIGRDGDE